MTDQPAHGPGTMSSPRRKPRAHDRHAAPPALLIASGPCPPPPAGPSGPLSSAGALAATSCVERLVKSAGIITRATRSSGRGQNLRTWESRNACVVVDVWVARGRRTAGGTRGSCGHSARSRGSARGRTRSCGAADRCRRAAGAVRPAVALVGAALGGGGADPARGRVHRRPVRHGGRGSPGMRRAPGDRHVALRRAVGGREGGHSAPVRDLLPDSAERPGCPELEHAIRHADQHPPGVDRSATGGRRPRVLCSPITRGWRRTRPWARGS